MLMHYEWFILILKAVMSTGSHQIELNHNLIGNRIEIQYLCWIKPYRDKITGRINVIHLHHKNTMSLVFTQRATFQCCLSCPDTSNTITIPSRLWQDNRRGGIRYWVLPVMSVMSVGAGVLMVCLEQKKCSRPHLNAGMYWSTQPTSQPAHHNL